MIQRAINFVLNSSIDPNLRITNDPSLRSKIQTAKNFIVKAKKVGDVYSYIKRSIESAGNYQEMRDGNLIAFEDIIGEFETRFEYYLNDCLKLEDFVIGETYSSYDICYLTKHYNVQPGIYFVKNNDQPIAACIKVTLNGQGQYPNEWYQGKEDQELKYYMQGRSGVFSEHYVVNSNIINTPNLLILVFIKNRYGNYTLNGIYTYRTYHREIDGSMWFHLVNNTCSFNEIKVDKKFADGILERKIAKSLEDSSENRRNRLQTADPIPKKSSAIVTTYDRNSDVIAEVLHRANGVCERCHQPAPFIKVDGRPYLEVHHVIPLSQNGEDTVENAEALCPNCHREKHYGINYNH